MNQLGQGAQSFYQLMSPEEAIKHRIQSIDSQLKEFSEERRNALLSERARLLRAGKELGLKL